MLKRLFTSGPIDPDKGVAFLENFLPGQAWVLAGIGARKTQVYTFVPQTYGHAAAFIADQLKHKREVKVMMATPARVLNTSPTREDLNVTRHIGIEVPDAVKPALDAFERPPAILLKGNGTWFAVWRFVGPVHPDIADKAEEALAKHLGGKRLNHFLPLPNIGGPKMVEFLKDRFVVPTDFAVKPASKALTQEREVAKFSAASSVKAKPINWLWPDMIAKGELSLISGEPSMGKSQIAIFIAATLSRGGAWPDGSTSEVGSAIICETEDDNESVVLPRLEAAGADVAKIAFGPHLDLTQELDALIAQGEAMSDLKLVVLSPIGDFFGAMTNETGMRARLRPLLSWAAKRGVAVVGIVHPGDKKDSFAGSTVFRKVARAAWAAIVDPFDDEPIVKLKRRLIVANKSNNGPDTARLAYRIKGVKLPSGINTSRVTFETQRVSFTAEEWLAGRREGDDAAEVAGEDNEPTRACAIKKTVKTVKQKQGNAPSKRRGSPMAENAALWLGNALKDGPRFGTELKAEAETAGISTGALYRAAKALGVVIAPSALVTEPKVWRLAQ